VVALDAVQSQLPCNLNLGRSQHRALRTIVSASLATTCPLLTQSGHNCANFGSISSQSFVSRLRDQVVQKGLNPDRDLADYMSHHSTLGIDGSGPDGPSRQIGGSIGVIKFYPYHDGFGDHV